MTKISSAFDQRVHGERLLRRLRKPRQGKALSCHLMLVKDCWDSHFFSSPISAILRRSFSLKMAPSVLLLLLRFLVDWRSAGGVPCFSANSARAISLLQAPLAQSLPLGSSVCARTTGKLTHSNASLSLSYCSSLPFGGGARSDKSSSLWAK